MIMKNPLDTPRRLGDCVASLSRALPAVFALAALAASTARADVVFSRSSVTGEHWAYYSATYTAPHTGNYTFGFNLTAGGPSGDNSILIDAVKVSQGATTVFSDGFETPALSTNTSVSANGGSATFGSWAFSNYSGILDGSPPNWGLAGASSNPVPSPFTLGSADGTTQYAYLQAAGGTLGKMKAANTLSLVGGQTYTISFYQASRYHFGGATTYTVTLDFVPPTQTLTILGGSGLPGEIAANVEYYNPATGNWQPAYLTGWHPWGFVSGTNSWINYKVNTASDPGAGPTTNQTLWYLYRVRFIVPADAIEPKMTFSLKADNFAQVAINGVTVGGSTQFINNANVNNVIVGAADQVNVDAAFTQNVLVGENTITLNIGDWGGLNGFNFRIDLSMKSSQPIEIVPVETDTTPPVIISPGNLTHEATSPAGAAVAFIATAFDDVDGPVPVTAMPPSGSVFPLGTSAVGLAATDAAGNVATAEFDVTVVDTTPPSIIAPADIVAEATSAAGATVSYSASASDIVDGIVPVGGLPPSGSTFSLGTSVVSLSASDSRGNTSSTSLTVTVRDTTAPAITVPANQVLEATGAAGAVATFAATATDAVGVTSLTYSHASGSTFPLGITTVTVTASDAAGNTSSGSFTVTVQDTTAPAITSLSTNTPTLWPPNHKMIAVTVSATATDLVGVASLRIINATSNEPDNGLGDGDTANDIQVTGDLTVNLRAERSGKGNGRVYTITVEARDAAGNATTRTVAVTVPKSQGK